MQCSGGILIKLEPNSAPTAAMEIAPAIVTILGNSAESSSMKSPG